MWLIGTTLLHIGYFYCIMMVGAAIAATYKEDIIEREQRLKQSSVEIVEKIAAAERVLTLLKEPPENMVQDIEALKQILNEKNKKIEEMKLFQQLLEEEVERLEIKVLKPKIQEAITNIASELTSLKEESLNRLQLQNMAPFRAAERMLVLLKKPSDNILQVQELKALKRNLEEIDGIVTAKPSNYRIQEVDELKLKIKKIYELIDDSERLLILLEEKENEMYDLKLRIHKAISAVEKELLSLKEQSVDKLKEIEKYKLGLEDSVEKVEDMITGDEVTVINKTVTGGKPETIVWPDLSFKMEIPPGSFPDEHDINISVSLDPSHRIEIPEGYKSLSQTYKITASERLQDHQSVILTLKHNGVITSTEEASSVTVLHQSEEGTVEVLQGTAAVNSSFVIFQLTQLCWIEIIGSENTSMSYSITFHRLEMPRTAGQYWTIRVLLSPSRRKTINGWIPDNLDEHILPSIIIKDALPTLKMEIEPIGCWTIPSYATCKNMKVLVNNEHDDITGEFIMEWRHDCTDPVSFIRLYDTEDGVSMFEVFKNPDITTDWTIAIKYGVATVVAVLVAYITLKSLYTCYSNNPKSLICFVAIVVTSCAYLGHLALIHYDITYPNQSKSVSHLKITQLEEVIQALRLNHFDTTKWKSVGLSLGLYVNTLSAIERNSNDVEECLHKTLRAWLERSDDVDNKGGATWLSLTRALRDNNLIAVAESIEEKYFVLKF